MNIAILTRPDYRSPRILSESLKQQLERVDVNATIFYSIEVLTRLNCYCKQKSIVKFHFWLRKRLVNYFSDKKLLKELKSYDAIIISECSPNGFWLNYYHIEQLRVILKKPIILYEVYYIENAPTQVEKLRLAGEATVERYDWHLAVADVTEISKGSNGPWNCVGIDLTNLGLEPIAKDEFIAVVDFQQKGYEAYQEEQIKVLQDLNIKIIVLEGSYTLDEIRAIYKKAALFFVQFPEAFGLPIAECLSCGAQIITPSSSWPMSWRLDENPDIHKEGNLPNIFTVYNDRNDLKNKLRAIQKSYNLKITPFQIFETFIKYYPHYYYGNNIQLQSVLKRIKDNNFK